MYLYIPVYIYMICIFHTYIWEGSKKKKSTSSKAIVAKGKSTVIFGWFQKQEKQSPKIMFKQQEKHT